MQDVVVALIVAVAVAVLAAKSWRAAQRRCRPKGKDGCDKCCKCG